MTVFISKQRIQCDRLPHLAFVMLVANLISFSGITQATTYASPNLLRNSSAEESNCAYDWESHKTPAGWTIRNGVPTVFCATMINPSITDTSKRLPASAGDKFFSVGGYSGYGGLATLNQVVNVSSATAAIDGGGVHYNLLGWFGGWTGPSSAGLSAVFRDVAGNPLGTATISATPADRSNAVGFSSKSGTGSVPKGTRHIDVTLTLQASPSALNDVYADALQLTLDTPVNVAALVPPASEVPAFDHVFIIMMENWDYDWIMAATDMPFTKALISRGASFSHFNGVFHNSDPNYYAVASGDQTVQGNNTNIQGRHLGDTVEAAGKNWRQYGGDTGAAQWLPCNSEAYPMAYYNSVLTNPARCVAHVFPQTQLPIDLAQATTTPNFSWITGNICQSGHNCGTATMDAWLKQTIGAIQASPAWVNDRSLIILTWDESCPAAVRATTS